MPTDKPVPVGTVRDGPYTVVTTKLVCDGCKNLRTERWEFEGENDDIDRGTDATCGAMAPEKPITAYWRPGNVTPQWCPRRIDLP